MTDADNQQALPLQKKKKRRFFRYLASFVKGFAWSIAFVTIITFATGLYFMYTIFQEYAQSLPDIEKLSSYSPSQVTTVYGANMEVLAEFYLEKRIALPSEEIPQYMKQATIAVEDSRFYLHTGLDTYGILRAAYTNVLKGSVVEGASTITMQLARVLFLQDELYEEMTDAKGRSKGKRYTRKFSRKIREALIARKLEQRFAKDEILTMYLNEVYYGHGLYGIEAAANYYFGKHAKEMDIAQCALLAALPKAPNTYSPARNPEKAEDRRNWVLKRMQITGVLTEKQYQQEITKPIELATEGIQRRKVYYAPYFVEAIRQWLEREFSTSAVHRGGLSVYTGLDIQFQKWAEDAVREGLRELDKRQGFRGPLNKETNWPTLYDEEIAEGNILIGTITEIRKRSLVVDVMGEKGLLDHDGYKWARIRKLNETFTDGNQILVRVEKVLEREEGKEPPEFKLELSLEQEPVVEGALLAYEPTSGTIKAWVGGYNFNKSKFNRVNQAKRQPGSGFKPFIYTAALEKGLTPASVIYDTPIIREIIEPEAEDEMEELEKGIISLKDRDTEVKYWKPENYERKFRGAVTLRRALEKSLNIITIQLLENIGVRYVITIARQCGIRAHLDADLSLALGTSVLSLKELARSYGIFPTLGKLVELRSVRQILDDENDVIYENPPMIRQVLDERTAYLMTTMLQGVVRNGTAIRASYRIRKPIAGKTGTTNDYKDAWFTGFSPNLVCGVWVGYDEPKKLGRGEAGSRAALPIWIKFMEKALENETATRFPKPLGISEAMIDPRTGLLAVAGCEAVKEHFITGSEPVEYSSVQGARRTESLMTDLLLGNSHATDEKEETEETYDSD